METSIFVETTGRLFEFFVYNKYLLSYATTKYSRLGIL